MEQKLTSKAGALPQVHGARIGREAQVRPPEVEAYGIGPIGSACDAPAVCLAVKGFLAKFLAEKRAQ